MKQIIDECEFAVFHLFAPFKIQEGAVMAVIVWYLDLQLSMQSEPITTDVVSSNFNQGEMYNIMW